MTGSELGGIIAGVVAGLLGLGLLIWFVVKVTKKTNEKLMNGPTMPVSTKPTFQPLAPEPPLPYVDNYYVLPQELLPPPERPPGLSSRDELVQGMQKIL